MGMRAHHQWQDFRVLLSRGYFFGLFYNDRVLIRSVIVQGCSYTGQMFSKYKPNTTSSTESEAIGDMEKRVIRRVQNICGRHKPRQTIKKPRFLK